MPWIEQVSIMVNELQTIMEIERLEDLRTGKQSMGFGQEDEDGLTPSDSANWGISYLKNGKENSESEANGSTKGGKFSALERFDPDYFILISDLSSRF